MVCATIANASPNRRKGHTAKPKDYLILWDRSRPRQSPQEQLAVVYQINAALGGTVTSAA